MKLLNYWTSFMYACVYFGPWFLKHWHFLAIALQHVSFHILSVLPYPRYIRFIISSISFTFSSFRWSNFPWLSPNPLIFITSVPKRITANQTASSSAFVISWYHCLHRRLWIFCGFGVSGSCICQAVGGGDMLYTWICYWNSGNCGWLSCLGFNICWNCTCKELGISW